MENSNNLNLPPIHSLDIQEDGVNVKKFIFLFLIVVIVGAATGFILSTFKQSPIGGNAVGNKGEVKKTAGILDKKTFKDKAEGTLKEGGIDGEGNFHLERPGGVSQNVYLTSSTIDLSPYINKKVRVWGQTFQAAKAGWLMDVGYVELIN